MVRKGQRGFTLVEITVVMAIIVTILAIAVPQLRPHAVQRGRADEQPARHAVGH
ncbi:MAG: type II secretion system protein [Bryobacterales bacterium]